MTDKRNILLNVAFIVICSVVGITDSLNAMEYYYEAEYYSHHLKISLIIFILAHPIILFFFYLVSLIYLTYLGDFEFNELVSDFDYYEMIYFRNKVTKSSLWILPLAIYLTVLNYFKLFPMYSLKFLIEKPENPTIFRNVIFTTLYPTLIIQSLFQSLPQIILQCLNNLLMNEDIHKLRGVFNFSTITSLSLIGLNFVMYFKESKKKREDIEIKL